MCVFYNKKERKLILGSGKSGKERHKQTVNKGAVARKGSGLFRVEGTCDPPLLATSLGQGVVG